MSDSNTAVEKKRGRPAAAADKDNKKEDKVRYNDDVY